MLTRKNLVTEAIMVWSRELEITAGTMETPELGEEGSKAACPLPAPSDSWLKGYRQTPPFLQTVLYPEIWVSTSMENTLRLFLPLEIKWAYRTVRQQSFAINSSHQKEQGSSLYPQEDHNYYCTFSNFGKSKTIFQKSIQTTWVSFMLWQQTCPEQKDPWNN